MTDSLAATIIQATHAVPALVATRGERPGIGFLEFFAGANHGEPSIGSSRDTNIFPRVTGDNPSLRDRARLGDTPDFHI
jgi:hypothetical protein